MFGPYYNKGQKVLPSEDGLGQVWISGYDFAHNLKQLKENKIFGVCSGVDLGFKYPQEIENLKFDLNDNSAQKVIHVFYPAYQFIERKRKETNVLVHCAAGISRCSVILISYMIRKYGWSYEECLKKCKAARPCTQPNMGFVKQLLQYQVQLKKQKERSK